MSFCRSICLYLLTAGVATYPAFIHSAAVQKTREPDEPKQYVAPVESDPLAEEALVAMFAGDRERLRLTYYQAIEREKASADNRPLRSSDAILYLFNSSLADREQFLAGQEIAAAEAGSEELRTRILMSLLSDELYELNKVEGQNRFNKFTRVFNRASTSLSQLIMLQPRAAVQLIWDGIYSIRQAKPATDRERKMVYLATNFLRKYPDAPESAEVQLLLAELRTKLNADRAVRGKATGKLALKKQEYDTAEFHLEKAAILAPEDRETSELLRNARALRIGAEDAQSVAMSVGGAEQEMGDEDASMLAQACRALACADAAALSRAQASPSNVRDSIAVGIAALTESQGRHDRALQQLAEIQRHAPGTAGARAAAATLANPAYNLDDQFEQALRDLAAQRRKYYWTGNRTSEDTAYQVGSATIQQGAQAASGVPVLAGADVAVRAITEQFRSTVDVDPVIDAGARYLRKYPNSSRSSAIAAELSDLAKKSRDYIRSEEYLAETGQATAEQLAKLHEKQAISLFERAMKTAVLTERRNLLLDLAQKFPDSKVVQKSAGKELSRIAPNIADDSILLVRKMLQKDPTVAVQLGLAPQYVDGNRNNGELAEEGMTITPSVGIFDYKIGGEESFRTAKLPPLNLDQLLSRARELQRDYNTQQQSREVVRQQRVPFAIDGGIGGSGVDLAPQLVPAKSDPRDKNRFN
ncbi:MAG: hypothetical protein ACR2IE_08910 [Candidatus Sumerlaeaceae bacterium]